MPYKRINVDEYIEEMRTSNPEFRQEWDNSMGEYQQQPVSVSGTVKNYAQISLQTLAG